MIPLWRDHMKRLELLRLTLRYFKGTQELTIEPKGSNMSIYGDNGTGKTTVADSLSYLLFDKDTENQSPAKFGIKTVDKYGIPIPGVDHEVEGVFRYGPRTFALRKV